VRLRCPHAEQSPSNARGRWWKHGAPSQLTRTSQSITRALISGCWGESSRISFIKRASPRSPDVHCCNILLRLLQLATGLYGGCKTRRTMTTRIPQRLALTRNWMWVLQQRVAGLWIAENLRLNRVKATRCKMDRLPRMARKERP
jgi:hypothetical protein